MSEQKGSEEPIRFIVAEGSNTDPGSRQHHPDHHWETVPDPDNPAITIHRCKMIEGCQGCEIEAKLREIKHFIGYDQGGHYPSDEAFGIVFSLSDGMGPNYDGGDWSAIRDSSDAAIRRMWEAIHA